MESRSDRTVIKGAFETAVGQVEAASRLRMIRAAPRQRLSHAIRLVDSMLGLLEQFNLSGSAPARGSLESGLAALRRVMPVKVAIGAVAASSPADLMNELFAVQQRLLAMRAGPAWQWAYVDEEREVNNQGP